jgi:hypothetical protein
MADNRNFTIQPNTNATVNSKYSDPSFASGYSDMSLSRYIRRQLTIHKGYKDYSAQ